MSLIVEISPLLASAVVTTVLSYWIWKCRKREKVYVKVGKVKNLFFYPMKSLKGIEVPDLECTPLGAKYLGHLDRSFLLVSDKDVPISQVQEPRLILLSVSVFQDHIAITNPDGKTLNLVTKELLERANIIRTCKIHSMPTQVIDCGDSAAEFFQDFLGRKDVRLVRYTAAYSRRRYRENGSLFYNQLMGKPMFTLLSDFAPLNIASQSSLDDLNTRLEKSVSIYPFRPNVLVDGASAFDEDNWEHVKFSSGVIVDFLLPCGRFRMAKDPEVSKVLEHCPMFAINCWPQKEGKIFVGNEVYAVIKEGHFICRE